MRLRRELVDSGTYLADPLVLDFGAPVSGYEWDLRRILACDQAAPQARHAGVLLLMTPRGSGGVEPTEIADASDFGLPCPGTWNRGTIVLTEGERLQLLLYGLPVGLVVTGTAQVEEQPG